MLAIELPITAAYHDVINRRLWKGSQAGLDCFDAADSTLIFHIDCGLSEIHALSPTEDGKSLLVGGGQAGQNGKVVRLSISPPHRPVVISTAPDVIYSIDCCRDHEQHFATACWDGICRVYKLDSEKPIAEYQGHNGPVLAIVFLDDKLTIASAGVDSTIHLWNGKSGQHLRTLDNHTSTVHAIAVRPISKVGSAFQSNSLNDLWIASASEDRTVRFWQPLRGRMMRFAKFNSIPRSIEWTEDGSRLDVVLDNGKSVALDPQTAKVME